MSKETTGLNRSSFWGAMILLVMIQAGAAAAADSASNDGAFIVIVIVFVSVLILRWIAVYMRIKNIGWHGAHTLWAVLPFVWIIFGCVPTGHANSNRKEIPSNAEAT